MRHPPLLGIWAVTHTHENVERLKWAKVRRRWGAAVLLNRKSYGTRTRTVSVPGFGPLEMVSWVAMGLAHGESESWAC